RASTCPRRCRPSGRPPRPGRPACRRHAARGSRRTPCRSLSILEPVSRPRPPLSRRSLVASFDASTRIQLGSDVAVDQRFQTFLTSRAWLWIEPAGECPVGEVGERPLAGENGAALGAGPSGVTFG